MIRISLPYLHKQSFLWDKIPHQHSLMGNIYELYYFYPTCIASGFIYELNYLYPAPSASGKHLLLTLVYTVHPNLSTCFFKFRNIFTISRLIICRNSVVKHKFKPFKSLENALFKPFYFSKLFIVGKSYRFVCNSAYFCICLFFNVSFMLPIYKSTHFFISSRKSVARWSRSRNLDNTRLKCFLLVEIIFKIDKFRFFQILCSICINVHCCFSIRMT